ncbi:MAG: hypothetical protein Ct9H300mP11_13990 [Chloroflexota bacterium]|nr:MAG: hypothetical protein Ct9H300mP11_13990 [Chloroflexota bacterium]
MIGTPDKLASTAAYGEKNTCPNTFYNPNSQEMVPIINGGDTEEQPFLPGPNNSHLEKW